jgi:hypothetical protein
MKTILLITTLLGSVATAAAMEESDYYVGTADGGTMSITVRGKAVDVEVGRGSCGGSGTGSIAKVGKNHWVITLKDSGEACTLDVLKQGPGRYKEIFDGSSASGYGTAL